MQKILLTTPPELLLSVADDKVAQIRQAAGGPPAIWNAFYQPVLLAFAEHVQRLPLCRDVFSEENGALDFGLISTLVALRVASTQMFFPSALSEDRRKLEPQCYFAAFVATLATAIAMVSQNTFVKSSIDDADYHPLVSPVSLKTWLAVNPDARMQWRTDDEPLTSQECAAIAARFIPIGLLNNFDFRVSRMVFGSIAPQLAANGIESTLSRVVRQSVSRVMDHQRAEELKHYQGAKSSGARPSFSESLLTQISPTTLSSASGSTTIRHWMEAYRGLLGRCTAFRTLEA
jgi:hypothetical protein